MASPASGPPSRPISAWRRRSRSMRSTHPWPIASPCISAAMAWRVPQARTKQDLWVMAAPRRAAHSRRSRSSPTAFRSVRVVALSRLRSRRTARPTPGATIRPSNSATARSAPPALRRRRRSRRSTPCLDREGNRMIRDKLPMLATLQLLAVNFAANIVPINGYNTGVLSDMYPTGFTPPGWVFSIWLLIYIGLLAYSVAAWRAPSRLRARAASVANLYYVNALANSAWIFAWHYRQVLLSVLIMLVILGTLAAIFWKLRNQPRPTWAEYFRVDAPFSLYFGWITAATLVNFGLAAASGIVVVLACIARAAIARRKRPRYA
ncbi:MAG: tryptophan-rich sensory protein [Gammaproteobacteria bacterium]|nr:tryptophan-rich sensory protein [Gammaproteobacteria bacterium]